MNRSPLNLQRFLLALGSLALGLSLMATLVPRHLDAQHSAPDNTSISKDRIGLTADQQKMNLSDRAITQKIRRAIHHDRSLPLRAQHQNLHSGRQSHTQRASPV